jgi:hypothetical protein
MISEITQLYTQLDPNKRDAKWMNQLVSQLRRDSTNLYNTNEIKTNKQYILAQQSMDSIKAMFKDKQFIKNNDFKPLGIWPKIYNILVEEITKNPPKIEVKSTDRTALSEKEADILILRNKAKYENEINQLRGKVGEPAGFLLGNDKFKSNIEEFYRLGLDPNDPEDIDFYAQSGYQRMRYEIAAQKLINNLMSLNKFDQETIRDFVLDILSCYSIAIQVYVDKITGEQKIKRIYPEEAFGIWGDKRDGSDDVCHGYLTNMTVREWIGKVGNQFDFKRDWRQLLWALNYGNNTKYTGFSRGDLIYSCLDNAEWSIQMGLQSASTNNLNWENAFNYKIYSGYVEFPVIDATAEYLASRETGEIIPDPEKYAYELNDQEEQKKYYKESYFNEQMYSTYFLATSNLTQYIYNWGKVYYQQLYGAFDEYAKGTMLIYRLEGESPAQITKPYVDFANLCFYRMKWAVYHAKPQKEQYVIEELVKVAKSLGKLQPQNASKAVPTVGNILEQLIQYKRENFVDIRSYPELEGKTYPVLTPTEGSRPGIDPIAVGLQAIEQWLEMQIAEKTGLNDMRLAQLQNSREGLKKGQAETTASYNSTGYLYRTIQYVKQHTASSFMNFTQDIVRFQDTLPYNYLKKLMGEENFQNLKILEDISSHRLGIIVQDYHANMELQEIKMIAQRSMDTGDGRGGISLVEYGIIVGEEDWKKGLKLLAFFKYKAEKKKNKREEKMVAQAQQHEKDMKDAEAAIEAGKGKLMLDGKRIEADAQKYVADKQYSKGVDIQKMREENEPLKNQSRAEGQNNTATHKANLEVQKPLI